MGGNYAEYCTINKKNVKFNTIKTAMSHKYLNQGSVGMFCHFLGGSFRRYSKKIVCSDIFARYK
jgi:hypothetical protein